LAVVYGADTNPTDDTIRVALPVNGQATVPYASGFETAGDLTGWFGSHFDVGSVTGGNTKLDGAHSGDKCYVTYPGPAGTQYPAGGSNGLLMQLYSPYYNLSSPTIHGVVVSFYQSIATEPEYDRSIFEYTIDTGKTWKQLGVGNDARGINWYSSAVYKNALGPNGVNSWDTATAKKAGFPAWSPGVLPVMPSWTSNDDGGPSGYIFVQYDMSSLPAESTVIGRQYVRFRYTGFSDYGSGADGFAIDDFRIDTTAPVLSTVHITGKVYLDKAGDSTYNGTDAGISGAIAHLYYFGTAWGLDTADANGDFDFAVKLPGNYTITSPATGYFQTQSVDVIVAGSGFTGQNIGRYQGSISGTIFNDHDNNGIKGGSEVGLAGYIVSVHTDSAAGAVVATQTTPTGGVYAIALPPYNKYFVTAEAPAGGVPSRKTVASYKDSVLGTTGLAGAVRTGDNLGFFVFADIKCAALVDNNGSGAWETGELSGLPTGVTAAAARLIFSKGATVLVDSTLGNGLTKWFDVYVDTGVYNLVLSPTVTQPGWVHTNTSTYSRTVDTSGVIDTLKFLFYHEVKVAGTVFNDLNGNGVKDAGETGLPNWVIHVSGNGAQNDTTDGSGDYLASGLGTGSHTTTLVGPVTAGSYTITLGAPYTVTLNSNGTSSNNNFGAFVNFSVSGNVFRDRNFNGTKQTGEEDEAGITVRLKVGATTYNDTTDSNGNYAFSDIGPGADTVTLPVLPAGYYVINPAAAYLAFDGASGVNVTGQSWALVNGLDSLKYTTLTPADYIAGFTLKLQKAWTAKKPTTPNVQNLAASLFTAGGTTLMVGIPDQKTAGGKVKGYLQPAKAKDLFVTFYSKKLTAGHSVAPRGLDVDNKGGLLLKRLKNLPADKQNNVAVPNLLALELNVILNTPAKGFILGGGNLAGLTINGGTYNGMSVAQFIIKAETLMTKWEFVPQSTFQEVSDLAAAINSSFRDTLGIPFVLPDWQTATGPALHVSGYKTVYASSVLKAQVGPAPMIPSFDNSVEIPTVYALYQNYPNPFNPTTNIDFDLPQSATVTMMIYNMLGQEVATLINNESMEAGNQTVMFNASNYASGVYFYRIVAQGQDAQIFQSVKKMVLVK